MLMGVVSTKIERPTNGLKTGSPKNTGLDPSIAQRTMVQRARCLHESRSEYSPVDYVTESQALCTSLDPRYGPVAHKSESQVPCTSLNLKVV